MNQRSSHTQIATSAFFQNLRRRTLLDTGIRSFARSKDAQNTYPSTSIHTYEPELNLNDFLYYFVIIVIFLGGALMLLFSGGILSIQNEDPLNLFLNQSAELAIFSITGVALLSSPFWLVPYIRRTLKSKEVMKIGVNHHARNRVQEILLDLELLEFEATSETQRRLINNARASCGAMISSLSEIVQKDGKKIDYFIGLDKNLKPQ